MRILARVLFVVVPVVLLVSACGSRGSGPGTLQFYVSGGEMVRQGLVTKDGWQLTFDHVYATVSDVTAYQTDPPYDPVYSADIIRYEISTALEGVHTSDLKSGGDGPLLLGMVTDAPSGAYNAVSWHMAPASAGDAAGYSLVLIGKAEKENQVLDFVVKLDWAATFICGDYFAPGADLKAAKGRLDPAGTADLEMTFAFDVLFGDGASHAGSVLNRAALGFEPLVALAQGDVLDTDLDALRAGLSDDDYKVFEEALAEVGYTGARPCYYAE